MLVTHGHFSFAEMASRWRETRRNSSVSVKIGLRQLRTHFMWKMCRKNIVITTRNAFYVSDKFKQKRIQLKLRQIRIEMFLYGILPELEHFQNILNKHVSSVVRRQKTISYAIHQAKRHYSVRCKTKWVFVNIIFQRRSSRYHSADTHFYFHPAQFCWNFSNSIVIFWAYCCYSNIKYLPFWW